MASPLHSLLFTNLLVFLMFSSFSGTLSQYLQPQGQGVGNLGINYGQIANNLPSPSRVAILLQSIQINRVKLYDSDPNVLQAFANTNVEFVIGLGNGDVETVTDPSKAQSWIQTHVQPYISQTKITCITVGNEILTGEDTQLMSNLLPAMKSMYSALQTLGLSNQVTVTTAHSTGILGNSYPPSSGSFQPQLAQYLQPILTFHSQTNSPFFINAYPFFAYMADPTHISLDYALLRPSQGMTDSATNLHYDNMLDAQIDSVYAAIKLMGHTDIEVQVSETGWPSKGDANEYGATVANAGAYNGNLIKRVMRNEGTPMKPNVPLKVYVFALFNENLKPGPTSERNYGLYYPNVTPVYDIGLQKSYLPQFYISSGTQRRTIQELYTITIGLVLSYITLLMMHI